MHGYVFRGDCAVCTRTRRARSYGADGTGDAKPVMVRVCGEERTGCGRDAARHGTREFDEETCSVFGLEVLTAIREHPERYLIEHIQTYTPRGFVFHLYVFDFTSFVYALPTTEARFDALRMRESNAHRLEKDRVEWVDVLSDNRSHRRYRAPFFNDLRHRLIPALRRFTSSSQGTI